jgi:hypothetical protein
LFSVRGFDFSPGKMLGVYFFPANKGGETRMGRTRENKATVIAEIKELLSEAELGFVIDYQGSIRCSRLLICVTVYVPVVPFVR